MTQFEIGNKVKVNPKYFAPTTGEITGIKPKTASRTHRLYEVTFPANGTMITRDFRHHELSEAAESFAEGTKVRSHHTFVGIVVGHEADTNRVICRSLNELAVEANTRKRYAYLPSELIRVVEPPKPTLHIDEAIIPLTIHAIAVLHSARETEQPQALKKCMPSSIGEEMLFMYGHKYLVTATTGESYLTTAYESGHYDGKLVVLKDAKNTCNILLPRQISFDELRMHGITAIHKL